MTIRPPRLSDAREITRLLKELGYDVSVQLVSAKLELFAVCPFDHVLVAERDGKLIGCISMHTQELFHQRGRLGRITSLVVDQGARSLGVGAALVEAAEKFFREHDCIKAEVTSGNHRPAAHEFYKAKGYAEDERRFLKVFPDLAQHDTGDTGNLPF